MRNRPRLGDSLRPLTDLFITAVLWTLELTAIGMVVMLGLLLAALYTGAI